MSSKHYRVLELIYQLEDSTLRLFVTRPAHQRSEVNHNARLYPACTRGFDRPFYAAEFRADQAQLHCAHGVRVLVKVTQDLVLFLGNISVFAIDAEIKALSAKLTTKISLEQKQRLVRSRRRRKPENRTRTVGFANLLQTRVYGALRLPR